MTQAFITSTNIHAEPPALPKAPSEADKAAAARLQRIRRSLLSDEWAAQVRAFRELMNLPLADKPAALAPDRKTLHVALLLEELAEVASAVDCIDMTDGLLDIIYVALGTLAEMGWSPNQIICGFAEVHQSNMTKVQDNGLPLINDGLMDPTRPVGKVLKTSNYVTPDLAAAMSYDK